MITKLVSIGNARGVRLPKAMLDNCGFENEVRLSVKHGMVVVSPHRRARSGWDDAFRRMAAAGDDTLLEPETETTFDRSGWRWP